MKKIFLYMLSLSFTAYTQEILTPEEAVRIAFEKNYSIRIARNNLQIAENNTNPGAAGFYPGLNADASYTTSTSSARQELFDGRIIERDNAESENLNAAVSLNWAVFDGFEMFANLDRYKQLRSSGELQLKNELEFSISEIYSAYYNIVRLQRILKLIQYNISLSEERVRIERDKKEVGSGSGFDLRQAEVDLNEDRVSFLREEVKLVQTKMLLKDLMGTDTDTSFTVVDTIPLGNDFDFDDLISQTEKNNSSIQLALVGQNLAEVDTRLARSDLFPTLTLTAGYNFLRSETEAGNIKLNRSSGYNYGVRASWNIFNGLNTRRNIENATILAENSKVAYEETLHNTKTRLINAFKVFRNSTQQINLELQNLKSAEENVDIALERLKLGNISPLEFREAQTNLLDAQNRLISSQVDAKIAETELLRISGALINMNR